jgi:hypothetical protein
MLQINPNAICLLEDNGVIEILDTEEFIIIQTFNLHAKVNIRDIFPMYRQRAAC